MLDFRERACGRKDVVAGSSKGEGERGADAALGAAGYEGVFGGRGGHCWRVKGGKEKSGGRLAGA